MVKESRTIQPGPTLPYGPTRGMLQALQLMRKTTPAKIDGAYLRTNKIAPGNEYKVVGALRFLDIIDDDGRPTENSRMLKTKGATFTAALQSIVQRAYKDLFRHLKNNNGGRSSQEDIYNYFVTAEGLGPEMANKTTRFFVQLCQMAEIDLGISNAKKRPASSAEIKGNSNGNHKQNNGHADPAAIMPGNIPFVLTITPEMAAMDTDEMAKFFKKLKTALAKANED